MNNKLTIIILHDLRREEELDSNRNSINSSFRKLKDPSFLPETIVKNYHPDLPNTKTMGEALAEGISNSTSEYIVVLESWMKVTPFFFSYIYDGILKEPDNLSCVIDDNGNKVVYSLIDHRFTHEYPTMYNVIRADIWKAIQIPKINSLLPQAIQSLLKESNLLREEYYIFDTLIVK
jgi:hypothetical protein